MQKSICLVACYFGNWPTYIDLFLTSCRQNPSVDFLLVSDCGPLPHAPDNVRVVPVSFEALKERITEQLGMEVAINRPYKLCDFKTAYGVVLGDYLQGYDFWGCTDLDQVYGRIRQFVPDELLDAHDVIAARPWYLTGFFFLFRNNEHVNRLFQKSRDYQRVYQQGEVFSFIECNFAWQKLRKGRSIGSIDTEIESMTEVIRREERNGLRVCFREMARESTTWPPVLWDHGVLSEGEKEWLLFHFVVQKNHWAFSLPNWGANVPRAFYISRCGLWDASRPVMGPLRDIRWSRIVKRGFNKLVTR
jgi:hypothetical protein